MTLPFDTSDSQDVTHRRGPWPEVNQHIEVFSSVWGSWLASRVEDRRGNRLVVAAPVEPGEEWPPEPPAGWLALRWTTSRGVGMVEGKVAVATRAGIVPTWELLIRGDPLLFQRRRYARVSVLLAGEAMGRSGAWKLTVLDLAEGGIRCLASPEGPLVPGEAVDVSFPVDGLPFTAQAEVVRWAPAPGGIVIALRFVDVLRSDADRLRRFVFRQELARNGAR